MTIRADASHHSEDEYGYFKPYFYVKKPREFVISDHHPYGLVAAYHEDIGNLRRFFTRENLMIAEFFYDSENDEYNVIFYDEDGEPFECPCDEAPPRSEISRNHPRGIWACSSEDFAGQIQVYFDGRGRTIALYEYARKRVIYIDDNFDKSVNEEIMSLLNRYHPCGLVALTCENYYKWRVYRDDSGHIVILYSVEDSIVFYYDMDEVLRESYIFEFNFD